MQMVAIRQGYTNVDGFTVAVTISEQQMPSRKFDGQAMCPKDTCVHQVNLRGKSSEAKIIREVTANLRAHFAKDCPKKKK